MPASMEASRDTAALLRNSNSTLHAQAKTWHIVLRAAGRGHTGCDLTTMLASANLRTWQVDGLKAPVAGRETRAAGQDALRARANAMLSGR
jgi:hypothetical protein